MSKSFFDSPESKSSDFNMVESPDLESATKLLQTLRISKIRVASLEDDLLHLQYRKVWKNFSEVEKIETALEDSEIEILKWHECLSSKEDIEKMMFSTWKSLLLANFAKPPMQLVDFVNLKQSPGEETSSYISKMEKLGKELKLTSSDRRDIISRGLRPDRNFLKTILFSDECITDTIIKNIQTLEKEFPSSTKQKTTDNLNKTIICVVCDQAGHYPSNCPVKAKIKNSKSGVTQNKTIHELDTQKDDIFNKETSIYSLYSPSPLKVLFDTGAVDNFISNDLLTYFKAKISNINPPLIRYGVNKNEIFFDQKAKIEFIHEKTNYSAEFLVFPKNIKMKILIGKTWIKNTWFSQKYECEINTVPGKRVTEKTYALSEKLRQGTAIAIEKLIQEKRISESQSSWVNNLNPVEKPDGTVRITTNLVNLNKLVEQDSYSLPTIDRLVFSLKDAKWFSKIDLKDGFFQIPLRPCDMHKTAFRF